MERITQALYRAIDEINLQLPQENRLDKKPNLVLMGDGGKLDSLAMVNFVVAVEQEIEKEFKINISLMGDLGFEDGENPFESLSALSKRIGLLLSKYGKA